MTLDEIETLIEVYGISVRRYEQLDSHEYYSAMVKAKDKLFEAIIEYARASAAEAFIMGEKAANKELK